VAGRVENTIGQTRRDVVGAVETDTILEKRATVTQTGSSSTSSKDIFGVEDIKLVRWLRSSMTKISVEKVDELVSDIAGFILAILADKLPFRLSYNVGLPSPLSMWRMLIPPG
ncbi:Hypothetical predicted protein, partial [Cloeon dipterum]